MKEKVVLAYSGGLIPQRWFRGWKKPFNYDVVCCCINCGQGNELDGLDERAKLSGASKLYIEDIVDEFCDEYIMPCVEAGAVYEHQYLLGTSMARPQLQKNWLRSHVKRMLLLSATALPVKEMTRSASSLESKLLLLTSRSLLHGVWLTYGPCSPVRMSWLTARHMESTFHLTPVTATAVTVTYGISAMKVLSLRILPASQTMSICSYLVLHQKKLQMQVNM